MPVVIRIVCAVLIAFLSAVTGAAAQTSAKGPVTVYDFTFPEEVAGAQRISFRDYESNQPGLGYSAGYHQGNLTGTVSIYDDGKQSIPDDPQSPLVKAQLEKSRTELVGLWHGVGVRVDVKEEFTIEDARGRTRLICAAFAITDDDGRPRDSFSCLGVAKKQVPQVSHIRRLTSRGQAVCKCMDQSAVAAVLIRHRAAKREVNFGRLLPRNPRSLATRASGPRADGSTRWSCAIHCK